MQRRFPRFRICAQAKIAHKNEVHTGEVDNLSLVGVFIKTNGGLRPGDVVDVAISYDGNPHPLLVSVRGEVVHVSDHGVGVKFDEIDLEAYSNLRNVIAHNRMATGELIEEYRAYTRLLNRSVRD